MALPLKVIRTSWRVTDSIWGRKNSELVYILLSEKPHRRTKNKDTSEAVYGRVKEARAMGFQGHAVLTTTQGWDSEKSQRGRLLEPLQMENY